MHQRNTAPMLEKQHSEKNARAEQRIGDTEELLDYGVPIRDIVARAGFTTPGAASRYFIRHGRHDLARPFGRESKRERKAAA